LKKLAVVLGMVLFFSFMVSQEVYSDIGDSTKEQKQFVAALFLVGFVGIFGFFIYLRKSHQSNNLSNHEN